MTTPVVVESAASAPTSTSTVDFAQPDNTRSVTFKPVPANTSSTSIDDVGPSRARATSTVSTASSISVPGEVSDKRRAEFTKHFAKEVDTESDDAFELLATQSCDLQSSVLIHGRLYVTPHHVCFRSNILGIVTKKIHPLKDVTLVEKGTTAKWIQNAVYVYVEGEDKYYGYGSLADRDVMYEAIVTAWKAKAPERYTAMEQKRIYGKDSVEGTGLSDDAIADSDISLLQDTKQTSCSGEHYKEVAMDIVLPLTLDQAYQLIYRNPEFIKQFYENKQGLKNVKITDWSQGEEGEERTLTYVMTISNPIGPNESDCDGKETIVAADPDTAYEVLSETHTPGVPSGKNFTVKTRTCLTHSSLHGRPATRMYCTSQCDWSSFSMLKSTITPAVIDGQKTYYKNLVSSVREWVKAHPDDYDVDEADEDDGDGDTIQGASTIPSKQDAMMEAKGSKSSDKSLRDHAWEIPHNPVMLGITLLCGLLLFLQIDRWVMGGPHLVCICDAE